MTRIARLLAKLCLPIVGGMLIGTTTATARGEERILDSQWRCFRSGQTREWSDFPEQAEGSRLQLKFSAEPNSSPWTLRLRQRDVRQRWRLRLNEQDLGPLPADENPLTAFWELPAGALRAGENTLEAFASEAPSDDVFLGDVRLIDQPRSEVLHASALSVEIVDAETQRTIPGRVTIVDEHNSLMAVGAESDSRLAVRPGVVYTSDGRAEFGLPVGSYRVFAGRGFEYGVDSRLIELAKGERKRLRMAIRREAPLSGYVACDTHVHTWTFSRHGDASLAERLATLAAEGLELPIATDHNLQIDYGPVARDLGLDDFFTPVVGNEVTTRFGHFNVFPLDPAARPIAHEGQDWKEIFAAIGRGERRVIVLNHPRDIHSGFRPFDPSRHIAVAGENLEGWKLEANAMELVNSGTLQSDWRRLLTDWFGLLNAGLKISPVGSSDSHDVSRSIVGQARTYIRCRDEDAGKINATEAVESLLSGRVLVSFGLAAEMVVNDDHGPGEIVRVADMQPLKVKARVWGPSWSEADQVMLFVNGAEARRDTIPADRRRTPGLKYEVEWTLAHPKHDVHLAVVALGPGIDQLYWPTQRPYQPVSPDWKPYSLAASGAVWIDADGKPGFASAREYALRLIDETQAKAARLAERLQEYDEAVAVQIAATLRARGELFSGSTLDSLLNAPSPSTRAGVRQYVEAWKESEAARGQ